MGTPSVKSRSDFCGTAEIVSKDGRASRFGAEKTIEVFQFLADLQHRTRVSPTPGQIGPEGGIDALFFGGRLAMRHFGPAQIGRYRNAVTDFTYDVAVWPRGPGQRTAAAVGSGSGWIVPAAAKNPNEAWAFLQHYLGPEVQKLSAEVGAGVPARRSVMDQVFVRQPAPPKNVRIFAENAKNARIIPQVPKWVDMMRVVNEELPALWRGERTAREVCTAIQQRADPILKG